MALASTGWDEYSHNSAWSPKTQPQLKFGTVVIGALLAVGAAAVLVNLHLGNALEGLAPGRPAAPVAQWTAPPVQPPVSAFARDAESFLRDSLWMTGRCGPGCYEIAREVAEARKLGQFASPTATSSAPDWGLQRSFHVPVAERLPTATQGEPLPAAAPLPAAPIHLSPSVVVPLPQTQTVSRAGALLPAPRRAPPAAAMASATPPETTDGPPLSPVVGTSPPIGRNAGVAVYDISAATVYMPDGARLEAHSGLGRMVDNPRYVDKKNTGPTPPGAYDLVMRKGRFHGVEALRLVPVDDRTRYGRDGLLTHTYLLRGRPGQSNGCVVFPNYSSFLNAFKRGHVTRLVVVASLKGSDVQIASAGR